MWNGTGVGAERDRVAGLRGTRSRADAPSLLALVVEVREQEGYADEEDHRAQCSPGGVGQVQHQQDDKECEANEDHPADQLEPEAPTQTFHRERSNTTAPADARDRGVLASVIVGRVGRCAVRLLGLNVNAMPA